MIKKEKQTNKAQIFSDYPKTLADKIMHAS
jgi:hypothetical protein